MGQKFDIGMIECDNEELYKYKVIDSTIDILASFELDQDEFELFHETRKSIDINFTSRHMYTQLLSKIMY
jgi:hypothetical protein